jgi:hypothetical protein
MERIRQLAAHLSAAPSGVAALQVPRDDDVVITMAVRSALGRQGKGQFKDTKSAKVSSSISLCIQVSTRLYLQA